MSDIETGYSAFPPETFNHWAYKVHGIFSIKADPGCITGDPIIFDDEEFSVMNYDLSLCWYCFKRTEYDLDNFLGLCDDCIEKMRDDNFVSRRLRNFNQTAALDIGTAVHI